MHLRTVFQRLRDYFQHINVCEYLFDQSELEFLGHLINQNGFKPTANAETRLVTDASDFGMGATLDQLFDLDWKPLVFFS